MNDHFRIADQTCVTSLHKIVAPPDVLPVLEAGQCGCADGGLSGVGVLESVAKCRKVFENA